MISRRLNLWIAGAILLAATASLASAQDTEGDWTFTMDSTFASQYLWRGFVLNGTASMQPNLSLGYKGFTVSSWSNFAYRSPYNQNWTEHDLTVGYARDLGDKIGVSLGYIWYRFPDYPAELNSVRDSHEVYAGVSLKTLLTPTFTYYRDFKVGNGDYFYLGFSHSQPLGKGVALNLATGAGLNHKQWISNTVMSNWDIKAAVDIPWGKVTFSPFFLQMIGHETLFGNHNAFGVNMRVASLKF